MKLFLAIAWTIIGIGDVILCSQGQVPTWTMVFCPLSVVIFDCWCDWVVEKVLMRKA